jgi:hypothetical protein
VYRLPDFFLSSGPVLFLLFLLNKKTTHDEAKNNNSSYEDALCVSAAALGCRTPRGKPLGSSQSKKAACAKQSVCVR